MKDFTIIQQLDAMLNYINGGSDDKKMVSDYVDEEPLKTDELIDKLVNDGNVKRVTKETSTGTNIKITPTVQGRIFFDNGGYKSQQSSFKTKRFILRFQEVAVISGGVTAAIYYTFEIFSNYIIPVFQNICHCVFIWQEIKK